MAKQIITALFDTREYATNASLMLRQAGIADRDVTISPESASREGVGSADTSAKGFWASLEDMFGGSDDHGTYTEGLRRGATLITVHADDAQIDDVVAILEQHGSVDLDERETTWRGEGWTGGTSVARSGVVSEALRSTSAVDTTITRTTAPVATAPVGRSTATATGNDESIKVYEESLNVGKRAVTRGRVRLHTSVVERPVTETVSLRDEVVSIDRRPVDRALGVADIGADAFQERTIEMEETAEEAVVAKTVRVVEEIGIRKDVTDDVKTITDTVRSTKVDIEDGRTAGRTSALGVAGATGSDLGAKLVKDLEVVGSDGQHVGIIDHIDGATIKLKKNDAVSGGSHHLIPTAWVASLDKVVHLSIPAADAKSRWTVA